VELILECATLAAVRGYKIFCWAGPGVAAEVAICAAARCPGVCVVGAYAPPVKDAFSAEEDEKTVRLIQEAQPDMLVAFGRRSRMNGSVRTCATWMCPSAWALAAPSTC
jgi:UDP-N-acetyl-D-mannosaminuronic acid transferase (WecB/TagA/CpsF family)